LRDGIAEFSAKGNAEAGIWGARKVFEELKEMGERWVI
jgi:hypothetical protein